MSFSAKNTSSLSDQLLVNSSMSPALLLQDLRLFSQSPLDVRRCLHLLNRLLFLIYSNQAPSLAAHEATAFFFAISKAFQCKDILLRRLSLVTLRELVPWAEDVIIVVASLVHEIVNSGDGLIRASAVRTLGMVIDGGLLAGVERHLRQGLGKAEADSVLFSTLDLLDQQGIEIVRRWIPEIQQIQPQHQHPCLLLMLALKQSDRVALERTLKETIQASPRQTSPMTLVTALRVAGESSPGALDQGSLKGILGQNAVLALEASRCIITSNASSLDLLSCTVNALVSLVTSRSPVAKLAALSLLARLVSTDDRILQFINAGTLNKHLEGFVNEDNQYLSTLAISILLKTGTEASIDGLLSKLSKGVANPYLVDAIRGLVEKFPSRQGPLIDFLGKSLRDDGGLSYKLAVHHALLRIMHSIPKTRDAILTHLGEFIEDCDEEDVMLKAIKTIGKEVTSCSRSTLTFLIRCLTNRLILEGTPVRLAVIEALGMIAGACPEEIPRVQSILHKLITRQEEDDEDWQVAALAEKTLRRLLVCPQSLDPSWSTTFYPLDAFEERLKSGSLDFSDLPLVPYDPSIEIEVEKELPVLVPSIVKRDSIKYSEGRVHFKSSHDFIPLTESDAEFAVQVRKHLYQDNLMILEFKVRNTIPGTKLTHAQIQCPNAHITFNEPINALVFNEEQGCFLGLQIDPLETLEIPCTLVYFDNGTPQRYPLNALPIESSDWIKQDDSHHNLDNLNFECKESFVLTAFRRVDDAFKGLSESFGLEPRIKGNELFCQGILYPSHAFTAHCILKQGNQEVSLEIFLRAQEESPCQSLLNLIF